MNTKETLEKINNYIWEIESDYIIKAMDSNDYTEEIKYNYSADTLTRIRKYIEEVVSNG